MSPVWIFGVVAAGRGLGAELNGVERAGLCAVWEPVEAEVVAAINAADAREAAAITEMARRHEAVLEGLLASGDVVPLRFGAVVADPDEVAGWLEAQADALRSALGRVAGCAEWSVRLVLDAPAATAEAFSAEQRSSGPGRAYLAARRQAAASAAEALDRRRRLVAEVADELAAAGWCRTCRVLDPADGASVARIVCLVSRDAESTFTGRLEQILGRCAGGELRAEVSGPWPPYEFASGLAATAPEAVGP